jgi:rhamnogalacturonyl hydrolase YesR
MQQLLSVRLSIIVSVFFVAFSVGCYGQQVPGPDYKEEVKSLYKAIKANYFDSSSGYYRELPKHQEQRNKASYLWPLCAIFQAENEIEDSHQQSNLIQGTFGIITRYYDKRSPAPGYASYPPELGGGDRFYDDNQWIGITLLDAYERLKNKNYLAKGVEIYRFMMTAYDTTSGGGLYWEEGKPTKNTCSNGPGIILALQLYKATRQKSYLDTALLLYNWVNKKLYNGAGLYYDNINVKTGKTDQKRYSYNAATMLQANVYLFELTGNKQYLSKAIEIAEAADTYFYGSGKFRDNLWFNAVMLRGLVHLKKHHSENKYLYAFKVCTDQAIQHNKNENGLIGISKLSDIVSQGGMLEILARFSALKL